MRSVRLFAGTTGLVISMAVALGPVAAQGQEWQKSYPISGKPRLTIAGGDSGLELHSCGDCRAIKIDIDWKDRRPSDFILKESQIGDQVNFSLEEKAQVGIHFTVRNWHAPQVTVETPSALDLDAKMSDGPLKVSGISGSLELRSSDGRVDLEDINGSVHLTASDGSIKMHNLTGTLESRSSDGSAMIDGKLSSLQVRIGDGSLDLTLADGSHLTTPSRIDASDGRVAVRLPKTFSADLDVHVGDGKLNCSLPITMNGYNSGHGSEHNLHGQLNGGGTALTIHTGDGNVTLSGQ